LDVRAIGELGVRHDRRRVRVHQRHVVALAPQDLARLRARVVELARLPDHDRSGADDEDALEVGALRHQAAPSRTSIDAPLRRPSMSSRNSVNRPLESCGPGAASGWYCTENAGTSRHRIPSSVPSFRLRCESSTRPYGVSAISPSSAHPSGSSAKPWLWLVISTRPVRASRTGWFTPRCPKGILN